MARKDIEARLDVVGQELTAISNEILEMENSAIVAIGISITNFLGVVKIQVDIKNSVAGSADLVIQTLNDKDLKAAEEALNGIPKKEHADAASEVEHTLSQLKKNFGNGGK